MLDMDRDSEEFIIKSRKLMNLISTMHSAQYDRIPLSGPATMANAHGLKLYLDKNAPSESIFSELFKCGISPCSRTLRRILTKMALAIDTTIFREESKILSKDGKKNVILHTDDNADHHLHGRTESCSALGNMHVGYSDNNTDALFNEKIISDLSAPHIDHLNDILPTEHDDEVTRGVIDKQNIAAIVYAFIIKGQGLKDKNQYRPIQLYTCTTDSINGNSNDNTDGFETEDSFGTIDLVDGDFPLSDSDDDTDV